ncbi:phage/plasmid primase, P4 family [Desulfobacula sp.]|uniref:DNA primase family protein n=1 Tax=Desulfobacula sp. TaxID=2593537 RepID=UPI002614A699|nr:DNA primase family protein [Desulfobacula sp.]
MMKKEKPGGVVASTGFTNNEINKSNIPKNDIPVNGDENNIIPIPVLPKSNKTVLKALFQNQDGDSYLFIKCQKDKTLHDNTTREWYIYTGNFWELDYENSILSRIKEVIDLYGTEKLCQLALANKAKEDGRTDAAENHQKKAEVLQKRITQLQTLNWKKNIIILSCSGKNSLGYNGLGWDKHLMLLVCQNGVIDLQEGLFRPGKPEEYIKTVSPIFWDGIDSPCPSWKKFLSDIFGQDKDVIDYVQRLLGYGITGLTTEHIYPILWGAKGRNGKGTLLETLKYVLGPLALKVSHNFFMQGNTKTSGAADAELMSLRGARLAWGSETNEKDRLDVAKVKELVGGDTISARPPYGKRQIEFKPSHLLLLITNKRPRVPANDQALWQRIHLIPFLYSFVDRPDPDDKYQLKVDKDLPEKLKKEAPGILAWLVSGCLLWQRDGLNPPKSVNDATSEYQQKEDLIGHFLKECCCIGELYRVRRAAIYKAYKTWCDDVGVRPLMKINFLNDIDGRFTQIKSSGEIYYTKVGLLE